MSKTKSNSKEKSKERKYSKKQFIQSDMYSLIDKDVLKIILKDNGKYTKKEVKDKLEAFKRKEVK